MLIFQWNKKLHNNGKGFKGKKVDLMFYKRDLKGQGNFRFSIFWTINLIIWVISEKKPRLFLDEDETGEWKSWLKTQTSKN